jgi:PAS domain S-box-containing protein
MQIQYKQCNSDMASILKILIVEDLPSDAHFIKHQIRKSGIQFIDQIVEDEENYVKALQEFQPDIILSDYSLPTFDGMKALLIREELVPLVPFILVTGSINEEIAVEVMKAGADDYILKDHITKIGLAIKQVLDKKETLRLKKAAEKQLRILSRAIEQNPASIILTDIQGNIEYVNPKFTQLTGYTPEEVCGENPRILKSGNKSQKEYRQIWETILSGGEWHGEFENINKTGEIYFESAIISPICDENGEITHFLAVKEDITEKKKIDKKIKLLAHSLESISECVTVTDNNNLIIYANESFCKTYGYEENEAIGRHRNIMLPAASFPREKMHLLLENRPGNWRGEMINQKKDGTLFPVLLSTSAIKDENDNSFAHISVGMDITDIIRNREELMEAKAKAEETNNLRFALLNNMSHEIRTPMNAIIGFAGLMAEANAEDKDAYSKIVQKSAGQLLSLIDEVILLSRLQSEKMTVNSTGFSPAESVKDIFSMFSLHEPKKEIELKVNIPKQHKNLVILSDVIKIRQVLTNLTSNAIKYTRQGSIEIGFNLRGDFVEFYVSDTGIGIPEHEQPKIFDTFYRCEQAITSAIGGTGLGLSISKELVGLLGGTIGFTSLPNIGSRFYFTVPLAYSKQEKFSARSKAALFEEKMDCSVLIVDDEAVNIKYLEVLLKKVVRNIDHASNGKEAIEMALRNKYKFILMDIKMPVMGGLEATRILKAQYPDVRIIAQTAFALPEQAAGIIQAGCDNILSKPVNKELLMDIIQKYS